MSPFSLCSVLVSLTSSSPHPVVLLGFLLFLGRHVRPDHVGDAAHSGRLCAEVQRPCPPSRLVCLNSLLIQGGRNWGAFRYCNWQLFSPRHSLFILAPMRYCHNNALHYSCFLYRPVLKVSSCAISASASWMENVFCSGVIRDEPQWCAFVSLVGIIYCFTLCLPYCLCCRVGDSSKFTGYHIQQIWPTEVCTVCPTPGVLPAK